MMSAEQFWSFLHSYDAAIFPIHLCFSIVAILLIVFMLRKPSVSLNVLINLFLAVCYIFIAIFFFLVHNKELSVQMHYFQPILMFLIAFLFLLDIFLKRTDYRLPDSKLRRFFFFFFAGYSIVGYPIIGGLLGHPYWANVTGDFSIWIPILGVYPCPTTILALVLLSSALPRADKKVMIPLLYWAIFSIFGPPLRNYGIYEDIALFLSGVYGLVMLIKYFKRR